MDKNSSPRKFDRIIRRADLIFGRLREEYERLNAEGLYGHFEDAIDFSEKLFLNTKDLFILLEEENQKKISVYIKDKLLQQYGKTTFGIVAIFIAVMHLEAARSLLKQALTRSHHLKVDDLHAAAWDFVCEAAISIGYINTRDPERQIDINKVISEFTKVSQSKNGAQAHPLTALKSAAIKHLRSRRDWFNKNEAAEKIVEELGRQYPKDLAKVADPYRIVARWIDEEGEEIRQHFTHWGKKRGSKTRSKN